ncbi:MAG: hypothetical protein KJ052_04875 [Candidatus Hydrogenedentes bacterium]|nr:hypothetical protein [Candidatus Hydrogenedentota bacterium]
MKSLIEITCPHCAAHGQVLLPPMGVMVVGPCPRCHELVAVFCGRALAINKEIMLEGAAQEKKRHLLEVLMTFLEERISETLVENAIESGDVDAALEAPTAFEELHEKPASMGELAQASKEEITVKEFDHFKQSELPLIDNPHYFRAIFD